MLDPFLHGKGNTVSLQEWILFLVIVSGHFLSPLPGPKYLIQRLNMNYKCSANSSGLLLENTYIEVSPFLSVLCHMANGLLPHFLHILLAQ